MGGPAPTPALAGHRADGPGQPTRAASFVAYVELDGSRSPKWFTLSATETRRPAEKDLDIRVTRDLRLCGIYKFDGDKLVVCLPEAEGSPLLRPTDFRGDGEGGLYLLTYQRAAKNWKPDTRVARGPKRPAGRGHGPARNCGAAGRDPDRDAGRPRAGRPGCQPAGRAFRRGAASHGHCAPADQ